MLASSTDTFVLNICSVWLSFLPSRDWRSRSRICSERSNPFSPIISAKNAVSRYPDVAIAGIPQVNAHDRTVMGDGAQSSCNNGHFGEVGFHHQGDAYIVSILVKRLKGIH